MTPAALAASLSKAAPPGQLAPTVQALWWVAKGDWDKAHKIVMDQGGRDAAWVHAYLHRVEGDERNAGGWYKRAGRNPSSVTLEQEWEEIARAVL